jgi:hypothetical protein
MAQQIKKKFIAPDAIDGSKLKLMNGEALRFQTPEGEVELLKLSSGGEVLSKGQEIAFKSQVETEASARQSGDESLQSSISSEVSRATAAEQVLQSAVSTEEAARIAGDADLQSQVDDLDGYAQDIRVDLDQEILDRQSAVSTEETARIAGDTSLQSSISSEISARETAVASVQSQINSLDGVVHDNFNLQQSDIEVLRSDVTSLTSNLSSEEQSRIVGDLSTLVESKTYTDNKISLVMSNLDTEALDSLVEVVSAFQAADGNLNQAISDLSASATSALNAEIAAREAGDSSLQAELDQEQLDRAAGDSALDSRITSLESQVGEDLNEAISELQQDVADEASARQFGDSSLQSQITQEMSDRQSGDQQLQSNIDSEEARAMGVESSLRSQISQEILDRESADQSLQSEIDAEESRAMGVESSLQSQITQEVSDRETAIQSVQSDIATEESRAMLAESGLQSQIDTEKGRIDSILLASDADKDSFKEIVDLINSVDLTNDDSLASAVLSINSAISSEQSARISADEGFDSRIEALETAPVVSIIEDEKYNVGSVVTHVLLDNKAEKIFKVCVGRLNAFKGEDYTVSEEGGKTKLTFIRSFAMGGDEVIQENEDVFVTYSVLS